MKLYFMKKEALDILKSNLDMIYNMYFTEKDNRWLWKICDGNPFVEFKEIPDFSLAHIDDDSLKGEIEFQNCKLVYKNLSFLTESQACDERLWAGLCHSVFYEYLRKRWDYDKKKPKTQKEAVSNIKSRFFFSGGIRAGLYRNSIAKCWWVGRNTYDATNSNPFEKLDIIGSNDISSKISDIFYSNNFSSNPVILTGVVNALKNFKDEGTQLTLKEHIRPSLQLLNAIGGGVILDCLSEDEITDIVVDNIYGIIQGDNLGVEVDSEDGYADLDDDNEKTEDVSDTLNEDKYIVVGHKVEVLEIETDAHKIISVNYLPGTTNIPPLAKQLLGKIEGDTSFFNGKTYQILKVDIS
ncbi:hypothetical protein CM240_0642 [Clostridium bornimense]|uniref:Uncharacterized protein n=1 Tax=Clostridium bornimense TaxID=1216932 RepID=W6S0J3_9CLOT|nr:DUF6339 family protein [Clostridium bornimense]CDM67807.1 hypothetical protein CM240_0642 [Clostridium bornimense]